MSTPDERRGVSAGDDEAKAALDERFKLVGALWLECPSRQEGHSNRFFMTRLFPSTGMWRLTLGLAALCLGTGARAESDGRTLMRYPTLSGNTIVFVAHDNLWSVPRTGGTASRLTAEDGRDVMPRFSPDGRWIAFTGEYQGNRDVYVIPAVGGAAQRLTFTSDLLVLPGEGDPATVRRKSRHHVATFIRGQPGRGSSSTGDRPEVVMGHKDDGVATERGKSHQGVTVRFRPDGAAQTNGNQT